MELKILGTQFFMQLQKEQQIDKKTSSNTDYVLCDLSLMKLGNN